MLSDGAIHRYWNNRLETFPLHTLNQLNMPDDVKQFLLQVGIPSKSYALSNFHAFVDGHILRVDQQAFFPIMKDAQLSDLMIGIALDTFSVYLLADGETDYINQSLPMFVSFITELDQFMSQTVVNHSRDGAEVDVKALVDFRHKLVAEDSQAFINLYTGLWSTLLEELFYELNS